jgi:YbbR domain-containing protein
MKLKKVIFNNPGLKIFALLIAFSVWLTITGKQRAYLEKSMEIDMEYFNVSQNIDVRNVRPEKVRITVRGTSKEISRMGPENFKLRIDLAGITEGTRMSLFTEDYLQIPENTQVVSIHPKMIEITIEEFMSQEVPIRVLYKGKLPRGVRLVDRSLTPEKVTIFGYKSQIMDIDTIYAGRSVDLSQITKNRTIKIPLKKSEEIIRFEDTEEVEVTVVVENLNENK